MKNIPDYKILEKMIDSGTHLNLSHVNHNFVELEAYDKHQQFLSVMSDIQIAKKKNETAIIFCNSINSCRSTEYLLRENGYEARSIHGDVPAKARIQNYNDFKESRL
jgi:superfamily II DNA/RNA helicase